MHLLFNSFFFIYFMLLVLSPLLCRLNTNTASPFQKWYSLAAFQLRFLTKLIACLCIVLFLFSVVGVIWPLICRLSINPAEINILTFCCRNLSSFLFSLVKYSRRKKSCKSANTRRLHYTREWCGLTEKSTSKPFKLKT